MTQKGHRLQQRSNETFSAIPERSLLPERPAHHGLHLKNCPSKHHVHVAYLVTWHSGLPQGQHSVRLG